MIRTSTIDLHGASFLDARRIWQANGLTIFVNFCSYISCSREKTAPEESRWNLAGRRVAGESRRRERGQRNVYTHPHVADELLVAYGFVRFVDGWRALGTTAVAKARVPASVVVSALIAVAQSAAGCAARSLEQDRVDNSVH